MATKYILCVNYDFIDNIICYGYFAYRIHSKFTIF